MNNTETSFDGIKQRLEEIVDQVSEEDIDLDEALTLYEEAVKLGLAACDASEIVEETEEAEGEQVEGVDEPETAREEAPSES